jgi:lysophospholipase L1-like esterase
MKTLSCSSFVWFGLFSLSLLPALPLGAQNMAAPATTTAVSAPSATEAAPVAVTPAPAPEPTKTSYKFDFGTGDAAPGFIKVTSDMLYTDARGFGFETTTVPAPPTAAGKSGSDTKGDVITSDKPYYFSVALPEGNYKVTVTFGNPDTATNNTVKAELRRLMLEKVATKPGEFVTKTFVINERWPQYPGGVVGIKAPRESSQEAWDWDKRLTFEFTGDHPSVAAVEIEKVDVPVMYIVGDSTSTDQMVEPWNSWGQMIPRWFKPEIAVANFGESGETLAGVTGEHRFDKIYGLLKKGDYVFIQFGHNDMKTGGQAGLDRFKVTLADTVAKIKEHGAQPVIVTAVARAPGSSGFNGYVEGAQEVGKNTDTPVVELNASSQALYAALGGDVLKAFTINPDTNQQDKTHHNNYGSYEVSKLVIEGIKANKLDLAKYIADDYKPFDPAKPDPVAEFVMPPSPAYPTPASVLGATAGRGGRGRGAAAAPATAPAAPLTNAPPGS